MRLCVVCGLIVALFTCGAFAQSYDDIYLPYNGVRVKLEESVSRLGKPYKTVQEMDPIMQKELARTDFSAGFSVYNLNEGNDRIVRIRITKPDLILSNGLHAGMKADQVVKAIGKPSNDAVFGGRKTYSYWYYTALSDPMMVLNVYLKQDGVVEELELSLPLI